MFLVLLTITEPADAPGADEHIAAHREWFGSHVHRGDFLITGLRKDIERAGIIVAATDSRDELETILDGDAYRSGGAIYEVIEFTPTAVGKGIDLPWEKSE